MKTGSLKRMIVLACVAVAVVGCGRRGPLEPPGGSAEAAAAPPPSLIDAIARPADEPEPEAARPDKPFVLDPLI